MIRTRLHAVVATLLGMTAMASAQEWPTRPITLIVPFAAEIGRAHV